MALALLLGATAARTEVRARKPPATTNAPGNRLKGVSARPALVTTTPPTKTMLPDVLRDPRPRLRGSNPSSRSARNPAQASGLTPGFGRGCYFAPLRLSDPVARVSNRPWSKLEFCYPGSAFFTQLTTLSPPYFGEEPPNWRSSHA